MRAWPWTHRPRSTTRASAACSPARMSPRSRGRSRPGSSHRCPHYAAAVGTARYVGEPLAVVVAKDRYLAEDAAELVAVDYEPLEPVVEPTAGEVIHERSFHYGDVDDALARADVVIRQTFRVPRFTCLPVECYGVVCDWDEPAGRLTAWANFQGPFTLHGVAAAALGLRADRFRLLTPPDSGGSFGVKAGSCRTSSSSVSPPALSASPSAGPRTAWNISPRAPPPRAGYRARGRLHLRWRARRTPLRRPRGRRRLRPRSRAGNALPHARVAGRRVPRPERRRAEQDRADEHDPLGLEPRLRRPAALLRPRARDGNRRPAARDRPCRARATQPRARRRNAVPHAERRPLRLGRLRGLPRPGGRARGTRRAPKRVEAAREAGRLAGSGSRASSSRRSRTWATSRSRRPPSSARGPAEVRQRRGRLVASIRSAASPCGWGRRRRARATAPSLRRSSPTSSAAIPTM